MKMRTPEFPYFIRKPLRILELNISLRSVYFSKEDKDFRSLSIAIEEMVKRTAIIKEYNTCCKISL